MANNKTIAILLFLLFIGFNIYATEPLKLDENIFSALQQTIDLNEKNNSDGIKDRNFLISIDASNPSAFVTECPNPQIGFVDEYDIGPDLTEIWDNLDVELCDFNSKNIWNMNHYGIVIFFPLNCEDSDLDPILNDFVNLSDGDNIISYLAGEPSAAKRKSFGQLYTNVQAKLDTDLKLPSAVGELMVTITLIYPVQTFDYEIKHSSTTSTVYVQSEAMFQNFLPYIEFVDGDTNFSDVSDAELFHFEKFYKRLYGYSYYFQNIDDLPDNSECSSLLNQNFGEYQESFTTFFNCYCNYYTGANTLDANEIEFLYVVQKYMKNFNLQYLWSTTFPVYCEPNKTSNWSNWHSGVFPDFVQNNNGVDWKDYLVNKITSIPDPQDSDMLFYLGLYYSSTTFADHAQLSALQRFDLISRTITAQYNPACINCPGFVSKYDIIYTLIKSVNEFDISDQEEFYSYIKDDISFFTWLWNTALIENTVSLSEKKQLCTAITELVLNQSIVPSNSSTLEEQFKNKNKLFVWKNYDGQPIIGFNEYYNAAYNATNHKSSFNYKVITGLSGTLHEYFNGATTEPGTSEVVFEPIWSDPYDVSLNPFELVAVISGDHAKWTRDCGSLISPDCEFEIKIMPAFIFSFYIAQVQSAENWETFTTSLEVVSLLVSSYVFVQTAGVPAGIFYGTVWLADLAVLVLPELYAASIANDYDVNEINKRVQRVELITNLAAGGLGIIDLLTVLKGASAYIHLSHVNAEDIPLMNKALLQAKHLASNDGTDVAKLCRLMDLDEATIAKVMGLETSNFIKIMLATWLEMKPALRSAARTTNDYKFLAKTFHNAELTKSILKFGEIKFVKFLDDFEDFTPFLTDSKLISRWTVLYGDGSDIYKSYRTNMDNLSKVDDYLNYNPTKKEDLAEEFLNVANKDNFISSFIGGPLRKNELEELNGYYYKEAVSYDDGNGIPLTEEELFRLEELEDQLGAYQHPNTINVNSNQIIVETSNAPQQPPFHFWADVKVKNGKIEGLIPNRTYDYVITYNVNGADSELRFGLGHYITSGSSNAVVGAGTVKFDAQGKIYYLSRKTGHYKSQPLSKLPQELDEIVNILSENNLIAENFVPDYTYI